MARTARTVVRIQRGPAARSGSGVVGLRGVRSRATPAKVVITRSARSTVLDGPRQASAHAAVGAFLSVDRSFSGEPMHGHRLVSMREEHCRHEAEARPA